MWYETIGDCYKVKFDVYMSFEGDIFPYDIEADMIKITHDDIYTFIKVKKDAIWNGSNFSKDTEHCMRASLVHDLLCIESKGNQDMRKYADKLYYKMCREDGMSYFRAKLRYAAIRGFVKTRSWF